MRLPETLLPGLTYHYTLAVERRQAPALLDEWIHRATPCGLRVMAAKTKGYIAFRADIRGGREHDAAAIFFIWALHHCDRPMIDLKTTQP